MPVLLYGSEIWGFEDHKQLTITCNNYLKRLLKLNKSTPTCMVYGETGFQSISELIDNRMVNFWFRIATDNTGKISSTLYKFIKKLYDLDIYKLPWLVKIKSLLDNNGMSFIFNDQTNINPLWLKNAFKLRCSDIYKQKWCEDIFNNSVCINYRLLTKEIKFNDYLIWLPKPYAINLCKFKCSNHKLPNVTGRYNNINVEDRICTLCNQNDIGDEFHYLLKCAHFIDHRKRYINEYYYTNPNIIKFNKLFNAKNKHTLLNLSKFVTLIMTHFDNEI